MPRGRAKPFGPAAYLDPAGGSTGPGVRRGRGVPVAGEALGFGELCAHRLTQEKITRPIQLR